MTGVYSQWYCIGARGAGDRGAREMRENLTKNNFDPAEIDIFVSCGTYKKMSNFL